VDWRQVLKAADVERLATLCWMRGAQLIQDLAPVSVAGEWRTHVLAAQVVAEQQWNMLRQLLRELEKASVRTIVLKGLPLSEALYGTLGARQCSDIDLFIHADDRLPARRLLQRSGWQKWFGESPFDESYRVEGPYGATFLEVHSILPGESLAHCRIEPGVPDVVLVDDTPVPVLNEIVLPVYLAANMAKHATPSLLSYVDLAAVWTALDDRKRAAACALAVRCGLARCFAWCLRRANALSKPTLEYALRLLGIGDNGRTSVHALLRLISLSDTPVGAARVVATWAWPRSLRSRTRELPGFWLRRVQRPFRRRFLYRREYGTANPN
jgi:hypothetical protein